MPRLQHRLSLRVVSLTIALTTMTAIIGISGIFSLQEFKQNYQTVKNDQFVTLLNITDFKGQSYEILRAANGMFLAENKNDLQWDILYIADKKLWLDKLFKQFSETTDNYQALGALKLCLYDQATATSEVMQQKYEISNRFFIQYKKAEQYKNAQMKQSKYDAAMAAENIMTLFNPMMNRDLTLEKKVKFDDVGDIINLVKGKISEQEYKDLNTLFTGEPSLFSIYQGYVKQLDKIKAIRVENRQLSYLIATATGKSVLSMQKKFLINLHSIEDKIADRKSRLYILLIVSFSIAFLLALLQIDFLKRVYLIRKVIDAGYSKTQDQIPIKGKDEFSEMARAVKDYIDQLLKKEQEVSDNNKKLKHLATHDGLTNIYNRRYFDTNFLQEHRRYLRYKEPYCLAMFDLDLFKNINDAHGHEIGDKVLIEFTARVADKMRQTDIFARFGGEEFVLLMPRTNEGNALILMQRIIEVTNSTPCIVGKLKIDFTTSIGLVEVQKIEDMQDPSKQLIFADKALYQAKQTGRNKVCVYQGE